MLSRSVLSHSLRPHGLQPGRLLCPWEFPGKSTGVGCHFLLQGSPWPRDQTVSLRWQVDSLPLRHAAATAKSLQSYLTLCDPIDGSPPDSAVPGILQARTLEWVAIAFSNAWTWKVKVKSLSRVRLLVTPWTAAHQAPPSMGFSRQEYWSGVPLPSPAKARGSPNQLYFTEKEKKNEGKRSRWEAIRGAHYSRQWCGISGSFCISNISNVLNGDL